MVEDAETGEQFLVDSGDPLFRSRLRAGVDERDAALAGRMRRAGVPLHRIDTDRDLVRALVEVVTSTRWRRAWRGAGMSFASPWWLVLGVLVVAALVAGSVAASRRRAAALAAAGVAVRPAGAGARSGSGSASPGSRWWRSPRPDRRRRSRSPGPPGR